MEKDCLQGAGDGNELMELLTPVHRREKGGGLGEPARSFFFFFNLLIMKTFFSSYLSVL